jgi:heme/copper-type cytochrome/quinol oxidase subunit 4
MKKQPESQAMSKRRLQRIGLYVLVALMILEALDYLTAQLTGGSITILLVLALINAVLIIQYFMHIGELFTDEERH